MKDKDSKDMILKDFDPVEVIISILNGRHINYEQATETEKECIKAEFVDCLLKELSKEGGKNIAPYLSDIVFHKKVNKTEFSICAENVSIRFEFKHDF